MRFTSYSYSKRIPVIKDETNTMKKQLAKITAGSLIAFSNFAYSAPVTFGTAEADITGTLTNVTTIATAIGVAIVALYLVIKGFKWVVSALR